MHNLLDFIETTNNGGQIIGLLYSNQSGEYFAGQKLITDCLVLSDASQYRISQSANHWKTFDPRLRRYEVLELIHDIEKVYNKTYAWFSASSVRSILNQTTIYFPDQTNKVIRINANLGMKLLSHYENELREVEIDELSEDKTMAWVI